MASVVPAYGGNCRVTFNLDGCRAKSARIIAVNFLDPEGGFNKSEDVNDGKITVDIPSDATYLIVASFEPAAGDEWKGTTVRAIVIPDCPMTVSVTKNGYTIGGAPEYESIRLARRAVGEKDYSKPESEYNDKVRQYVKENPDDVGAAFVACDMGAGILSVDSLLGDNPKRILHGYYDYFYNKHMAPVIAKRNADLHSEGVEATDFTLTDIDGKEFSLSSLRGKTVILDFWGSWCAPCIKSMPRLKDCYGSYRKKGLEIVSVACNDTDAAWRGAVERTGNTWINVFNGVEEKDVSKSYGITAYPTMFIISPEGRIVKKSVGESDDFFTLIDEMMR